MTELFHGTVHIHTLKWDFHLSHAVPFHSFTFLHMPPNATTTASRGIGFIQSEHIALYSNTVFSLPLQGLLSAPRYLKMRFI